LLLVNTRRIGRPVVNRGAQRIASATIFACLCSRSISSAVEEPRSPELHPVAKTTLAYLRVEQASERQAWEECLALSRAILDGDATHQPARMMAAWASWNLRRFSEAAKEYGRVSGPNALRAQLWRAHSLAASADWEESRAAYAAYSASAVPFSWFPVAVPGHVRPEDPEAGSLYWRRMLREHPKQGVPEWMLGNCYAATGRNADAAAAYSIVLESFPGWEPAIIALAMVDLAAGQPGAAAARLNSVIEADPKHIGALRARAHVYAVEGKMPAGSRDLANVFDRVGRVAEARELVGAATMAWRAGRTEDGVARLNDLILWATEYPRAILGDSDADVLGEFVSGQTAGDPDSPLGRYALASSTFGVVAAALGGDAAGFLLVESLQRINEPTDEDVARFAGDEHRRIKRAAGDSGFGGITSLATGSFVDMQVDHYRLIMMPHLGRCVRELEAALTQQKDFHAARVLLAQIRWFAGQSDTAIEILSEVVRNVPRAISARVRLSTWLPLDKADTLLDGALTEDRENVSMMRRRIQLCMAIGDHEGAADEAGSAIRVHGGAWDLYEAFGISLTRRGHFDAGAECLEHSSKFGRTGAGSLALAELRERLGKPGVVAALIDGWRSSEWGSSDEQEILAAIRRHDVNEFICGNCGGDGNVPEVSGGQYVSTRQIACGLCLGLGLWHAGVK
jgi:tetratricopeptide (TPR) repeat protein